MGRWVLYCIGGGYVAPLTKKEYDFPAKQTSCKGTIHYIISHHILGLSRTVDYYSTVLFLTL